MTRKFYQHAFNSEDYNRQSDAFNFHVDLVQDLALELTRAANYVCETVRTTVLASYRLENGVLTVESGPHQDLGFYRHRPEYRDGEKAALYPGIATFLETRTTRDEHFGIGVNSTDPRFLAREQSAPW